MRRFGRSVVASLLALAARGVVQRYKPHVYIVTGSVGKTASKDALAEALSTRYLVRKSEKNANSEFGVSFTILGVKNPRNDPVAWAKVALRSFALLTLPNHYPTMLVLEVGADRPGDLAKLLRKVRPSAVLVTALPEIPVHVEFYVSPEAVREEEFSPARTLPPGAPLVISADDPFALEFAASTHACLWTFGMAPEATVRLGGIGFWEEGGKVAGMCGHLSALGEEAEVAVRGAVGRTQLLPLAAAAAAALAEGVSLTDAAAALAGYEPPEGRGRLLVGVHNSTLIDDTYNASPVAVEEALENLKAVPGARKIAVLGDMLELGRYSVMEHERIGERTAEAADLIVTVGIRSKGLAEAARAAGKNEEAVRSFDDSVVAAKALPELVSEGDIVLIKGSQSIRMERVTAALLADPADRASLVRQEPAWQRR